MRRASGFYPIQKGVASRRFPFGRIVKNHCVQAIRGGSAGRKEDVRERI